ncbi:MAG: dienelactone hydrolase family protein [Candidatus Methylacidiphilales bacterium]|nr:dienelactone hydrolase family protein [Candidatus Methylacidiphilales bacterium]
MKASSFVTVLSTLTLLLASSAGSDSHAAPSAKPTAKPAPASTRTGEMIYLRDFGSDEVGFLSVPMQEPPMGLLVIPDGHGLDARTKKLCDLLAERGFLALAVDLYNGRVAADDREARTNRQGLEPKDVRKALETGLNFYAKSPRFQMSRVAVVAIGDADAFALDLCRESKNRSLAAACLVGGPTPLPDQLDELHARVQRLDLPASGDPSAGIAQIVDFLNAPETRKNFFQRLVD